MRACSRAAGMQLHGQIARALEEKFADIVASQPEIVAHHFTEAGLVEPAIDYWLKAGQSRTQPFSECRHRITAIWNKGLRASIPGIDNPMLRATNPSCCFKASLGNSLRATKGWSTDSVKHAYTRGIPAVQREWT